MGGTLGIGNIGPVVEFNFAVDPEAAHIVFSSGVDLTMIPLEVCHQSRLLRKRFLGHARRFGNESNSFTNRENPNSISILRDCTSSILCKNLQRRFHF